LDEAETEAEDFDEETNLVLFSPEEFEKENKPLKIKKYQCNQE
jgi:hypothetical protein